MYWSLCATITELQACRYFRDAEYERPTDSVSASPWLESIAIHFCPAQTGELTFDVGNKHVMTVVLHLENVGPRRPFDLLHIAPWLIPGGFNQRPAQFRSKTGFAAPDELGFLLVPGDVEPLDAVYDLVIGADIIVGIIPGPEAEVGHEPYTFLGRRACENPYGVFGVGYVLDLVLDGKHEFNVALGGPIPVSDQRAVNRTQHSENLPPVILAARPRGHDMQVALRDEGASHTGTDPNGVEIFGDESPLSPPVLLRTRDILEQSWEGGLALWLGQGIVAGIARVFKFPARGDGLLQGSVRAGETGRALEGSRGLTGTVAGGDELRKDRMDVVAVGVHAIPDGEDNAAGETRDDAQKRQTASRSHYRICRGHHNKIRIKAACSKWQKKGEREREGKEQVGGRSLG